MSLLLLLLSLDCRNLPLRGTTFCKSNPILIQVTCLFEEILLFEASLSLRLSCRGFFRLVPAASESRATAPNKKEKKSISTSAILRILVLLLSSTGGITRESLAREEGGKAGVKHGLNHKIIDYKF